MAENFLLFHTVMLYTTFFAILALKKSKKKKWIFFFQKSFEELVEPEDIETGWRAKILPEDHPVNQYEFDVLIGADGKRNTLKGFKRKEFRGKLAIAITANFINK